MRESREYSTLIRKQKRSGIRRSLKAAVTRFSHAHHARADRHGDREVAGCGTAKSAEPTVGPSRRDCRRWFGPRGTAKRQ
jgi:hypothetical protein